MRRASRLPAEELQAYLVDAGLPKQIRESMTAAPLEWSSVFGNAQPVEVEVGSGKGMFLLAAAEARSDTNFLGLEIQAKYAFYAANRLAKRQLTNARMCCCDARAFFRVRVASASVQALYIFFPDPWWKQKHRKRRLLEPNFVAECARVLHPGGRLLFVTDVEEYFNEACELLLSQQSLRELPPPEPGAPRHDLDYLTNFERKYRKQGKPIYRALLEKQ